MRYVFLALLFAGCTTARAQEPTPTPSPVTSGSETEEIVVSTEPQTEDTLPVLMSPPSGGEIIVPLAQGAVAPFAGILLNDEAAAWLESEPDAVQERAQFWVNRRLQQIRLFTGAEIERLQLRLRTQEEIHQIAIRARDEQNASLLRVNEDLRQGPFQWWEQVLYMGGALLVGLVVGFIAGFAN